MAVPDPGVLRFSAHSASRQGVRTYVHWVFVSGRGRKKNLDGTALEAEQLGASRKGI
jgi:hypothetical protein